MKKRIAPPTRAHLLRGAFYLLVLLAGTLMMPSFRPEAKAKAANPAVAGLTFAERLAYQRAIEEVYWRHRLWPRNGGENAEPKPSLDAVMSQAQLETKVEDYLRNSQALDDYWQRPITTEQLQAEMDRMARDTKQPDVLRELFSALGNDPFVIAECLARPLLAERLTADLRGQNSTNPFGSAWLKGEPGTSVATSSTDAAYTIPEIPEDIQCTDDTWTATNLTNAPVARYYHTAVWTGNEMIVWGGYNGSDLDSGGRYTPSTDSWTATSMINVPTARDSHTAVWTGSEMIVWGGTDPVHYLNTGERFNPTTNTWTGTSIVNAPSGRYLGTAVWTGSEMIVWGGINTALQNTGGRYNPGTDSWTATNAINAPAARYYHTAVWTGSEMIVWGGGGQTDYLNTGGRYDPSTDTWTATNVTGAPVARWRHSAVW